MRRIIAFLLLAAVLVMPAYALANSAMYSRIIPKNAVVTKIKLNSKSATIVNHWGVTDTYRLIPTVIPIDAADKRLTWSSSDENIVTVSPDGLVTAVGEGKAVVSVSADDRSGMVKAQCSFKVKATRVSSFSLDSSVIYLDHTSAENTAKIGYKITPSTATFQNVSWSTENENIARVDSRTGLITAVSAGRTTIRATVDAGRKKANCDVIVRDKGAMKTVTICAVGDLVLGGDPDHNNGLNRFDNLLTGNGSHEPDYSYNLKNARPLFESCDLTVGNLEAALTNRSRPVRAVSSYNFRGKPPYARILAEGGVDVVSIVNNHTNDFGSGGLNDTKSALDAAGVRYTSARSPAIVDVNGVKVAVVGIMTQSGNYSYAIRRRIRAAGSADLIIVLMHCAELTMYDNVVRSTQIANAKSAIDAGADMVVCAHPAVISGIGEYKGKYIYFDIGTFVGSGMNTNILNYAVTQTFRVGTDAGERIVECDIPTIYPGHSSGYSKVKGDILNNCQPVLFPFIDTDYARAMSNTVASTIRSLSRKLNGAVRAAQFNVG